MSLTTDQKIALSGVVMQYIATVAPARDARELSELFDEIYLLLESKISSAEQVDPAKPATPSVGKLRM
jgi:hypothetical protein